MITKPTVMILGAGASMPSGFPSGEDLFRTVRSLNIDQLADKIQPAERHLVHPLQLAVRNSLDQSLDAMLELRPDLQKAGKAFMARELLQIEHNVMRHNEDRAGAWYRALWRAFDLSSLEAFRRTPLKIVTYNYDRSLEYALINSLQQRFMVPWDECAAAMDCIGPIHLHGQLGFLPGTTSNRDEIVAYGSMPEKVTDADCIIAARNIRIVHEPKPTDAPFLWARNAISAANRVTFLGFGYAPTNIERLQLPDCMEPNTEVFLCKYGFTPEQDRDLIRPYFKSWPNVAAGAENEDILQFFRKYPMLLL